MVQHHSLECRPAVESCCKASLENVCGSPSYLTADDQVFLSHQASSYLSLSSLPRVTQENVFLQTLVAHSEVILLVTVFSCGCVLSLSHCLGTSCVKWKPCRKTCEPERNLGRWRSSLKIYHHSQSSVGVSLCLCCGKFTQK